MSPVSLWRRLMLRCQVWLDPLVAGVAVLFFVVSDKNSVLIHPERSNMPQIQRFPSPVEDCSRQQPKGMKLGDSVAGEGAKDVAANLAVLCLELMTELGRTQQRQVTGMPHDGYRSTSRDCVPTDESDAARALTTDERSRGGRWVKPECRATLAELGTCLFSDDLLDLESDPTHGEPEWLWDQCWSWILARVRMRMVRDLVSTEMMFMVTKIQAAKIHHQQCCLHRWRILCGKLQSISHTVSQNLASSGSTS